jgi:hypothetical protein
MESKIQDIINRSISFIDRNNHFNNDVLINLYEERKELLKKRDTKYQLIQSTINNDSSLEKILKYIYKKSKSTTYENLERKFKIYCNENNIVFDDFLEHMEFKGVIDQGKYNVEGLDGTNSFFENEEEELILEKVKLIMNQNTKYYCFCNEHNAGTGLRYLNIFKINENYFIIGSSCIEEIQLFMEDKKFKDKVKKNLLKMKNSMTKCLNKYLLSRYINEFNQILKDLDKTRTEIELTYNEIKLKRQQQEERDEESRRQRRQIQEEEYERLLKEKEEREKKRILEFRKNQEEEKKRKKEEIIKLKEEKRIRELEELQRQEQEKKETMFYIRIDNEFENKPLKEYEKELEIEYQEWKKHNLVNKLDNHIYNNISLQNITKKEQIIKLNNKYNNILEQRRLSSNFKHLERMNIQIQKEKERERKIKQEKLILKFKELAKEKAKKEQERKYKISYNNFQKKIEEYKKQKTINPDKIINNFIKT